MIGEFSLKKDETSSILECRKLVKRKTLTSRTAGLTYI